MSDNALTKAKEELATLRARMSQVRVKANAAAHSFRRDGTQLLAAHMAGRYESDNRRRNQSGVSVMGLDSTTTIAVVAYAGSMFFDGEAAELAHDIALGVGCGIAYKKGLDSQATQASGVPQGP